jgi:hypothetical protein
MTDYKPFSHSPEPRDEPPRTVAAVLEIGAGTASDGDDAHLALRPLAGSSLFHVALARLAELEADERLVCTGDDTIARAFEAASPRGVRLLRLASGLRAPLVAGARELDVAAELPRCSHALVLGARHPFLRASTLDEAIRLFRLRTDIGSLRSCVRLRGEVLDPDGRCVLPAPPGSGREGHTRWPWQSAGAFELVPLRGGSPDEAVAPAAPPGPMPFEISAQEAFEVQSDFELELAAAYAEQHPRCFGATAP